MGYCVIRDYVFLIFVKGENTKLKSGNCEWFACCDTLFDIRDFHPISNFAVKPVDLQMNFLKRS